MDFFGSIFSVSPVSVMAQFESFNFLFGVPLGHHLLSLADNLSTSLQSKKMSTVGGQTAAKLTVSALKDLRQDEKFRSFWGELEQK